MRQPSGGRSLASRFEATGEALGTLVVVGVLSLLVVPLLPALTAGTVQLRRQREGLVVRMADQLRTTWQVFRESPATALAGPAPVVVLLLGAAVVGAGLPLGRAYLVVLGATTLACCVVVLRACPLWSPGARWRDLCRESLAAAGTDVPGTAALTATLVATLAVAALVPPLVLLAPGVLALASVGVVDRRGPGRGEADDQSA
jgi:hypothetical protein